MEATRRQPGVNIGSINQHGGNAAYASNDFTQTATTNLGPGAAEIVKMITAVRELGWLDETDDEAVGGLAANIQASTTDEERATAIKKVGSFFGGLYDKVNENPTAAALLTALGNYIAISAGISGS